MDRNEVQMVGRNLWNIYKCPSDALKAACKDLEECYWDAFIRHFGSKLRGVSRRELDGATDLFIRDVNNAEMPPLLERLQSKGVRLAICSDNTEFWFRRQMSKLGLYRFFKREDCILSFDTGVSKASPGLELFRKVSDTLGIEKESCLFVDDMERNIDLLSEHGFTAILFPSHSVHGARFLDTLLSRMHL